MVLFVWLDCVVATKVVGRKFLRDMGKGSPVLVEMGLYECFLCVWAILAVLSLVVIFMARTKNTGKGKATSSSVERALKKRKVDTSQVVKKKARESARISHQKMRKKGKMRRLSKCKMNLLKLREQSGPSQLQREAFTVKEA